MLLKRFQEWKSTSTLKKLLFLLKYHDTVLKPQEGNKLMRKVFLMTVLAVILSVGIFTASSVEGLNEGTNVHAASAQTNTYCAEYWRYRGEYVTYAIIDAQMCSNGSQVWQGGWLNCSYQTVVPGYSVNQTWCGTYNNNGSYVDIGSNFTFSGYGQAYSCWWRVRIYADGHADPPRGC